LYKEGREARKIEIIKRARGGGGGKKIIQKKPG
jgi:hypothetical protein